MKSVFGLAVHLCSYHSKNLGYSSWLQIIATDHGYRSWLQIIATDHGYRSYVVPPLLERLAQHTGLAITVCIRKP